MWAPSEEDKDEGRTENAQGNNFTGCFDHDYSPLMIVLYHHTFWPLSTTNFRWCSIILLTCDAVPDRPLVMHSS